MKTSQDRPDPREHMGARIVIVVVVAAILVLISAFIWPGWAHKKKEAPPAAPQEDAEPRGLTPEQQRNVDNAVLEAFS
ncbi:MAG: hypothetical protein IKT06_03450, partial [Aeriscardovia sp.]|nr:hypothetical protein [Aeriscardovia sp.]